MIYRIMFILQRSPLTQEDKNDSTPYGQSHQDIFKRTASIWEDKWGPKFDSSWSESEEGSEHKPPVACLSTFNFKSYPQSFNTVAYILILLFTLNLNDLTCHIWRGSREVLRKLCRMPAFLVLCPPAKKPFISRSKHYTFNTHELDLCRCKKF